jgi:GNAT superfamily N-acetyltransferase
VPRQGTGIGNFGHVYTEPSHRRKGISTVLVGALVQDFMQQKAGKCLLCGAGETAAKIYQPFGFRLIRERSVSGPMALIKPDVAKSFAELDEWYFAPGLDAKVREGHIGDRHDCDRMLDFSKGMIELRRRWHTVFIAHQVSSFMDALFHVEDGKGITTVMQNTEGSILGYAFVLALGSPAEKDFKIMDFVLHPNYLDRAAFFVRETVRIARSAGISQAHAFVTACDKEKLAALTDGGFNEEHRFVGKFSVDGRREDIAVLVC